MPLLETLFKEFDLFFLELFKVSLNPEHRRLWLLVITAKQGPYSIQWFDLFKSFGIVHLLVFSGSQVGPLRDLVVRFFSLFPAVTIWQITISRYLFLIFLSSFLLLTGTYLKWPAPATRAIIFILVTETFVSLKSRYQIAFVFSLHLLVFPSHWGTLSWALSWGCWFLQGFFLSQTGSQLRANILTSGLVWVLFGVWFNQAWMQTLYLLPFVISSNLIFLYLFEKFLFKIGALFWLICILCSVLGWLTGGRLLWAGPLGLIFKPIIEGVTGLLLVALKAIGYIKGVL